MYKRQALIGADDAETIARRVVKEGLSVRAVEALVRGAKGCLLYTSDAADERSSVDLGGRRIIKKKNIRYEKGRTHGSHTYKCTTARTV